MNGLDLMKKLGSGVMPAGVSGTPSKLGRAGEGSMFESFLKGVVNDAGLGEVASGLKVSIAKDAGLTLSEEQLGRLAKAADKAEAAGAKSALVELDGAYYTLDVASRQVTGVANMNEAVPLGSLDAVVKAPQGTGSAGESGAAGQADANWLLKRLRSAM